MKKKNGFTLVELMGVIALLGVIIGIAVPSVLNISANIRENMYCTKLDLIKQGAQLWGEDHYSSLSEIPTVRADSQSMQNYLSGVTSTIKVGELVKKGYLKKDKNSQEDMDTQDPRGDGSLDEEPVYVYIRNKRVYAYMFPKNTEGTIDEKLCD